MFALLLCALHTPSNVLLIAWKCTQESHNNLPVHPCRSHVCSEPKYIIIISSTHYCHLMESWFVSVNFSHESVVHT